MELAKLKEALAEIKKAQDSTTDSVAVYKDSINEEVLEVARREAQKSDDDIYEEVFIDEVN